MTTLGTANYCIRIVHPVTQRFVAELDPVRMLLLVVDKRIVAPIDLPYLIEQYYAAQGGTVTIG
jgi:hypothetical protein